MRENDAPPPSPEDIATAIRAGNERENATPTTFVLSIVEGADVGKRVAFDGAQPAPVLVGQGPACHLRLVDRHVSRRHAAFETVGDRMRVRDLVSTNGTYVDGVSVGEAFLAGGELIRIGGTALALERIDTPPTIVPSRASRFGKMLGASLEMRRLYPLAQSLAESTVPVVIEGETGTGKEVLAESMHEASGRASGPYVVFDCTAVPANLIESELFGHERGAFTGATTTRKGLFEQADGGTLLIDEIGDLDIALQSKLLRAIERSEVRRIGANQPTRVNVRVLAATRRDLDFEVQAGRFRDDLFHRLAVGRIELPPLRRRRGDVAVLVRHFWQDLGGEGKPIPADLMQRWEDYAWPGNVRELRNTVARHLALASVRRTSHATEDSLVEAPSSEAPSDDGFLDEVIALGLPLPLARMRVVEEFERRYIAHVLAAHNGNVLEAAAASGVARRYFQILRGGRRKR